MLITCFLIGVVFIPIGVVCLSASSSVVEYVARYDNTEECMGYNVDYTTRDGETGKKVADTEDFEGADLFLTNNQAKPEGEGTACFVTIDVKKDMKAPVFLYYEMDNFFQNHRRYVTSRSDLQNLDVGSFTEFADCDLKYLPQEEGEEGEANPNYPCGLVAWSFFNDTYALKKDGVALAVDETGIAWDTDVDNKFDNDPLPEELLVLPKDAAEGDAKTVPFINNVDPAMRGGGVLQADKSLAEQEHFVVWMRTAALPRFRKLWGIIRSDIPADSQIRVEINNRYNTYRFKGKKKVVLSTASWLGGKNAFLGIAFVAVGAASMLFGLVFLAVRLIRPRALGDPALLSWNQ